MRAHVEPIRAKPSKKTVLAWLCVLIIVVAGWQVVQRLHSPERGSLLTAQGIKLTLAAEIPPKASRSQVEAWLDAKMIWHHYYAKMGVEGEIINGKSQHAQQRVVLATVDKTTQGLLTQGMTVITFLFNINMKLIRYEVEEILTGL